jgi:hypothetical protein
VQDGTSDVRRGAQDGTSDVRCGAQVQLPAWLSNSTGSAKSLIDPGQRQPVHWRGRDADAALLRLGGGASFFQVDRNDIRHRPRVKSRTAGRKSKDICGELSGLHF